MFQALNRIRAVFTKSCTAASGSYRVFTQDFDIEVASDQLNSVLGPLPDDQREAHEQAWAAFSGGLQGWRTEAHLSALEASARIRRQVEAARLADTTVTFLVDQSGSMRGQSMILAAAACDVAQDFLRHLGISVEILGFTTASWLGGKSRERWVRRGRPPQPGRLCDLLHIVYRQADDARASTVDHALKPMLRPDLTKENVDGEAILWAVLRLRSRPQTRKILVVLSDGAPVDDSTLKANDLDYLDRHLRQVVQVTEATGDVRMVGVGIGFDPSPYYSTTSLVASPEDLGQSLVSALEVALTS